MNLVSAAAPRGDRPAGGGDPFGDSFVKLAFLLNLPRGVPSIQLGAPFFHHAKEAVEGWEPLPSGAYGLAVWQPQGLDRGGLAKHLLEIRKSLTPDASLVLLAHNPLDLRRLAQQPGDFCSTLPKAFPRYRQLLCQAGFAQVEEFWAFPCGRQPEEFLLRSPGAPNPFSGNAHPLKRLLQRCGLGHLLHDRFLYLASSAGTGLTATLRQVEERLGMAGSDGRLVVERFDLRRRGALVMICRRRGGERLILRMAARGEVAAVVGRNHRWIRRLHGQGGLAAPIQDLIPRPLAEFTVQGAQVFIEEALEGELAWKVVARKGLRPAVLAGACHFLASLQEQTAAVCCLDQAMLDRLLPDPGNWADRAAGELGAALAATLRRRLHGRRSKLVWGHGDFGYGNLLVDPRRGLLKGVIDWDTGTEYELPGLDLANLLVQKVRIEEGKPFLAALTKVGTGLLENGPAAIASEVPCVMLQSLTVENIKEIMALCCLRFVHRSARYPTVFTQDLHENMQALNWALGLCNHDRGIE
jgi:aminoglycoside phosphotransferase (APT) family kinase protein